MEVSIVEIPPSFLHGFVTLFTWLTKKCYEAFCKKCIGRYYLGASAGRDSLDNSIHRGKYVALWLFGRHLQGESDSLTGSK